MSLKSPRGQLVKVPRLYEIMGHRQHSNLKIHMDPGTNELTHWGLRPRQNGRLFPDDILKKIFLNENVEISMGISLKFVPRGPINNISTLVQIMTWRRPDDKPLSEPTRTTRTPAFWGYPPTPHDYPILLTSLFWMRPSPYYWPVNIRSQVKTRWKPKN